MRIWIAGVLLTGAIGGGVAYVLAEKQPLTTCCKSETPKAPDACGSCQPTLYADDAEVTDLSGLLAAAADSGRPRVSFEEPAFAVRPAALTTPAVEVAPEPRLATSLELAPMPRPAN